MLEAVAHGVAKERERCARLNEMLADMYCKSADRTRKEGEFTVRALWPLFKKIKVVGYRWERTARDIEAAAHSLRTVALCIRRGYDPDNVEHEDKRRADALDAEKICFPETTGVDGDPTTPYCRVCYRGPCQNGDKR